MKNKRITALLLGLLIPLALVPFSALAEDSSTGLCPHHPEHTAQCGYAATEGTPCGHVHDSACGYAPEVPCNLGCAANAEGVILHVSGCAYTAAAACAHTHDDNCGYSPARVTSPCAYVCAICAGTDSGAGSAAGDPADDKTAAATDVTVSDSVWSDRRYLASGAVTIPSRVTVSGDVTLVLAENTALTVSGGICVPTGASLTICAQGSRNGSLTAAGADGNAAIGGNAGQASGSITVYSGTVKAGTIGGGTGATEVSGTVTVSGGSVTADTIGGGSGSAVMTGGLIHANIAQGWTFSTGDGHGAVIFGTIADQSKKASWNAVTFDGTTGQVHGQAAPNVSFTIPADAMLTVQEDAALTISGDVAVTNNGRLLVAGSLSGSVPGRRYYRILCSASGSGTALISANGVTAPSAYAVAGANITVLLTPAEGGKLLSATVAGGGSSLAVSQTAEGISFTMPAAVIRVSAAYETVNGADTTPADPGNTGDEPGNGPGGSSSGGSTSKPSSSGGSTSKPSSSGNSTSKPSSSGSSTSKPSSSGNSTSSGSTSHTGANAPAYTVTIPSGVSLGGQAVIRADSVNVGSGTLTVTLADSENDFTVVNADGDTLRYSVSSGSTALTAGSDVLSTKGSSTGQALLTFSEPLDEPVYAGTYTDTLTFSIAVK